jgi:lipopolysaccharide transport system ATP-binding protein
MYMSDLYSIKLVGLRKVYPQNLVAHLASLVMAGLGVSNNNVVGRAALSNITLAIGHGERVGIIGSNGAGKSTLLQLLAGISNPTSGQMTISGKVTAILTLGLGLREDLTGRENIYLDGQSQGRSRKNMNAYVDAIVDFAELGKFIDLPLRTYSTGMKARLAFAMITQINPEILIIDEALSVGDAAFSMKAGHRISQLCSQGGIALIVSHSMQSIQELCNRCIWLDQGKLVMDGSPEKVAAAYLESVREVDELNHMTNFRDLIGSKSFIPGFILSALSGKDGDKQVKKLTSGSPFSMEFDWTKLEAESFGKFFLQCIRLDGTLIFENEIPLNKCKSNKINLTYPNLNLAPGFYQFKLGWVDGMGLMRAESSDVLEVIATDAPAGGRPVLLNLGTVKCIQIAEEMK